MADLSSLLSAIQRKNTAQMAAALNAIMVSQDPIETFVPEYDSLGNPMPLSYVETITKNASGQVVSIVRTKGGNTWTQTVTYPDALTTTFSEWIKS